MHTSLLDAELRLGCGGGLNLGGVKAEVLLGVRGRHVVQPQPVAAPCNCDDRVLSTHTGAMVDQGPKIFDGVHTMNSPG